jgi:organic radical activating enzyme
MQKNHIILEKKIANYTVVFLYNNAKARHELHIKAATDDKNFAVHTRYNLLDKDGTIIEARPITPDIAKFLFKKIEVKGETESFNIFENELKQNNSAASEVPEIEPTTIRHIDTKQEKIFTSTGGKLYHHWPVFKKLSETGYGTIIRATMTNTQQCTSHCPYCSTILRNRKDSVSLDEAKAFVEKLYFDQADYNKKNFSEYNDLYKKQTGSDLRLRGLILSGGGQPNLWPHFSEFVKWLNRLDIDLGLITNGFPPNIDEEIYTHFKWIRISITPEDASPHYNDGRFDLQYIPKTIQHNVATTVGLSYVFGPWTDDDILRRIDSAIDKFGFDYCRLLADCNLTRNSQLISHNDIAERLFKLGFVDKEGTPLTRIFHQFKYHGTPEEADLLWNEGQCFLQSYNVFWDTTGHETDGVSFCYPCDSITVLAEESADGVVAVSERKFNPLKWGTVKNNEVEKLFTEPVRPFFDPRKICSSCLFMKNNRTVKELVETDDYKKIETETNLDHINFP